MLSATLPSFQDPVSFSALSTSSPATSPSPVASQPVVTVDVPATKVDTAPTSGVNSRTKKKEPNLYDVSPKEVRHQDPLRVLMNPRIWVLTSNTDIQTKVEVLQNGAATKQDTSAYNDQSNSTRVNGTFLGANHYLNAITAFTADLVQLYGVAQVIQSCKEK